jgi:hypothetical protein
MSTLASSACNISTSRLQGVNPTHTLVMYVCHRVCQWGRATLSRTSSIALDVVRAFIITSSPLPCLCSCIDRPIVVPPSHAHIISTSTTPHNCEQCSSTPQPMCEHGVAVLGWQLLGGGLKRRLRTGTNCMVLITCELREKRWCSSEFSGSSCK